MLKSLKTNILNMILPPICVNCKEEGFYICENCINNIDIYKYFVCPVCKKRTYDGILEKECSSICGMKRFLGSPLPYTDKATRKLIQSLKYNRAKNLAYPIAEILINFLENNDLPKILKKQQANISRNIYLSAVPMYNFRERERGFNQSYEIASYIGAYYKIPVKKLVRKHRDTRQQADIDEYKKRLTNISGAFSVADPHIVRGKIVILVDDVYTTGATMRECARALHDAGAKEVWGMTAIRGY